MVSSISRTPTNPPLIIHSCYGVIRYYYLFFIMSICICI